MLIRSQDKVTLTNFEQVTDLTIVPNEKEFEIYVCYPFSVTAYNEYSKLCIGTYSTNEKAIKVLDMIQEKYQEPIYQNVIGNNETAIYKNMVFQMPQDSEV